ncbi:MAG TPA: type I phosphomannose isomerase catalytic subunit [Pirellulales bacterium]|nr:type I phosphomannose isomerase catalytic subunit [Pirellulales bacterium]
MLPPLRFEPILRRYLWGGRRLGTLLGKALGEGDDYAESWEVCDRPGDQSRVARGPLEGLSLGELVRQRPDELLGRHAPLERFPLLFKFLDAQKTLSVQVHPDDDQAGQLDPPDLGKTEAWVVLDAQPGSLIYAGLKRGFDREALERELRRGTCELCLHCFEPRPGDCIFIPAGMVHAIGAGVLVAEIQQSSDVTYRLFDFNRVGPDGRPRTLHIDEGLTAIDYRYCSALPQTPQPGAHEHVERLVECDKFVLDRWKISSPETMGGDERCHLLAVLEGELTIAGDPDERPLQKGSTALLPASLGKTELRPRGFAVLLDAYLPG